jgi:hypothetical protein
MTVGREANSGTEDSTTFIYRSVSYHRRHRFQFLNIQTSAVCVSELTPNGKISSATLGSCATCFQRDLDLPLRSYRIRSPFPHSLTRVKASRWSEGCNYPELYWTFSTFRMLPVISMYRLCSPCASIWTGRRCLSI